MTTLSILITEDEEQVRNLLRATLSTQGYELTLAVDGQDAVERFPTRAFDAVLMDINMPRKDGVQAIREIRAMPNGADVPIVVITALDTPEWETMAREAGANLFMSKPFSPKDVLHCLRSILDRDVKNTKTIAPPKAPKNVKFKVRFQSPEGFINCYLKNLMDRRSFVLSKKVLPLGSTFNFEITPPEGLKPFTVSAEVRWINLYEDQRGMGVQFSFENAEDEQRVHDWVLQYQTG